jgi:flagellar M-ring protein FliF
MPTFLQPLLDRIGGPRRVLIALVGIGAAVAILVVANVASRPEMVPLEQGISLEESAKIDDALTAAGIEHRLERGGADILVASTDLATARVAMAKAGAVPDGSSGGWELFDNPGFGMTDFTMKVNYRRALQGELERTIVGMGGIQQAKVHLALNEAETFRRRSERPTTASVTLKMRGNVPPSPDVVQGIQSLVATSVSGMTAENVSVISDGRLLSLPADGSAGAMTSRQLAVRKEFEDDLYRKAREILDQVVGPGNAIVQVTAELNFDKVARTSQTVDPDRQALSTEQKAEIIPGPEGGAGSTNSAIAYENSRTTETFEGALGTPKRLNVAVAVNWRAPAALPAGAAGVAAADSAATQPQPRSDEELANITELVRTAVGADAARGDVVTVRQTRFEPTTEPEAVEPTSTLELLERYQRPGISVLGLLLATVVAILALKQLKPPAPAAAPKGALASATPAGAAPLIAPDGSPPLLAPTDQGPGGAILVQRAAPRFEVQVGNTVLRDQTIQVVEQNPDDAARLFRVWLREG